MVSVDNSDPLLPLLLDHFSALISEDDWDENDEDAEDSLERDRRIDLQLQASRERVENYEEIIIIILILLI